MADEVDELDELLAEQMEDPAFAAAYQDANNRSELLHSLAQMRVQVGLTQRQVADAMGVRLRDVEKYERGGTDPRLSFHQRYARAVGARVRIEVVR